MLFVRLCMLSRPCHVCFPFVNVFMSWGVTQLASVLSPPSPSFSYPSAACASHNLQPSPCCLLLPCETQPQCVLGAVEATLLPGNAPIIATTATSPHPLLSTLAGGSAGHGGGGGGVVVGRLVLGVVRLVEGVRREFSQHVRWVHTTDFVLLLFKHH